MLSNCGLNCLSLLLVAIDSSIGGTRQVPLAAHSATTNELRQQSTVGVPTRSPV